MRSAQANVEELEREQRELPEMIQTAAMLEDSERFLRLSMRASALPKLIREERARPIREEVSRLESEREQVEEEIQAIRNSPPPEVPAGQEGQQTPEGLRQAALGDANRRGTEVGKELRRKRKELREIEDGNPRSEV